MSRSVLFSFSLKGLSVCFHLSLVLFWLVTMIISSYVSDLFDLLPSSVSVLKLFPILYSLSGHRFTKCLHCLPVCLSWILILNDRNLLPSSAFLQARYRECMCTWIYLYMCMCLCTCTGMIYGGKKKDKIWRSKASALYFKFCLFRKKLTYSFSIRVKFNNYYSIILFHLIVIRHVSIEVPRMPVHKSGPVYLRVFSCIFVILIAIFTCPGTAHGN